MSYMASPLALSMAELYFNGHSAINTVCSSLGISQGAGTTYTYVALFTDFPGDGATQSNECTTSNYGGYARVPVARNGSSNKKWTITAATGDVNAAPVTVSNADAINFAPCTSGTPTVKYWGLFDAISGGNLMVYGPLKASGASWKVGMYSDTATNITYSKAHGLALNDPVFVMNVYNAVPADLPNGATAMTNGALYYARDITTDSFKLATTAGGAAVAFTNMGPYLFIKAATLSVSSGTVCSFSAGNLVAARIC